MDPDRRDLTVLRPNSGEIGAVLGPGPASDSLLFERLYRGPLQEADISDDIVDADDRITHQLPGP